MNALPGFQKHGTWQEGPGRPSVFCCLRASGHVCVWFVSIIVLCYFATCLCVCVCEDLVVVCVFVVWFSVSCCNVVCLIVWLFVWLIFACWVSCLFVCLLACLSVRPSCPPVCLLACPPVRPSLFALVHLAWMLGLSLFANSWCFFQLNHYKSVTFSRGAESNRVLLTVFFHKS